jgi:anhydro-N-acetylmuramic acid kinase
MVRVIGLISGTSVDGIDAALVDISTPNEQLQVELLAGDTYPYPSALRQKILDVCGGMPLSMEELAELDDAIGHQFAQAALSIQAGQPPAELIGSHGQTVFHRPPVERQKAEGRGQKGGGVGGEGGGDEAGRGGGQGNSTPSPIPHPLSSIPYSPSPLGYSLQLGRGALIAYLTRITTVSNFRAADMAAGGQGAPLVPAVDLALLTHPTCNRCVQNIGGIGNVAYLPAGGNGKEQKQDDRPLFPAVGWDTGPGNVLLDLAVQQLSNGALTYDQDGAWAARGTPCEELVNQWLKQEFFRTPPPKSTGRELFGVPYLQQCLADAEGYSLKAADILATLTELTAASIADSYQRFLPHLPDQVLLCGGGSQNLYLKQRLQARLNGSLVLTTDEVGLSAAFKEAIAFAVLAYWRQQGVPGNLPEVTGATKPLLLGEIHQVI